MIHDTFLTIKTHFNVGIPIFPEDFGALVILFQEIFEIMGALKIRGSIKMSTFFYGSRQSESHYFLCIQNMLVFYSRTEDMQRHGHKKVKKVKKVKK
jgi:hypothetical protein